MAASATSLLTEVIMGIFGTLTLILAVLAPGIAAVFFFFSMARALGCLASREGKWLSLSLGFTFMGLGFAGLAPAYDLVQTYNPAVGGGILLWFWVTGGIFVAFAIYSAGKAIRVSWQVAWLLMLTALILAVPFSVWTFDTLSAWHAAGLRSVTFGYVLYWVIIGALVLLLRRRLFAGPPHPEAAKYLAMSIILIAMSIAVLLAEYSYDLAWKRAHPYENSLPMPARRTGLARAYGTTASRNETGILHAKN